MNNSPYLDWLNSLDPLVRRRHEESRQLAIASVERQQREKLHNIYRELGMRLAEVSTENQNQSAPV